MACPSLSDLLTTLKASRTPIGIALFTVSALCCAQDPLIGTYYGYFTVPTLQGDKSIGMTVVIASAENGRVEGRGIYQGGKGCKGDFPLGGSYRGGELKMRSTAKFGPARDCSMRFRLTVEGNQLIGHTGRGHPAWFSK